MEISDRLEDADMPDGSVRNNKINRKHMTSLKLHEYKSDAKSVDKMSKIEKRMHIVMLMNIMGDDDVNYREAEYIRRRIDALRGLNYNGMVKGGKTRRRDPVMVQIRKIQRMIVKDRKEQGRANVLP